MARVRTTDLRTRSRNVPNGRAVGGVGPLTRGRVSTFETLVQRRLKGAKALALQAQANRMIATLILHTRPQRLLTNFVAGLKAVLREQHGLGAAGYARARSIDGFTPEHEAALLVAINARASALSWSRGLRSTRERAPTVA